MKYIEVTKNKYHFTDIQQRMETELGEMWVQAMPDLMEFEWSLDGIKEWFVHTILKKHFTFGQPYCAMCGLEEKSNVPSERTQTTKR